MREAWRELMFADEQIELKASRDPVAPARRSEPALQKMAKRTLEDGSPVHSVHTLMDSLGTIVPSACRTRASKPDAPTFQIDTAANPATPHQAHPRARLVSTRQAVTAPAL